MTTSLDAISAELNASLSSAAPGLSTADALCATCVGILDVDGAAVSVIIDGASSGTFGSSSETSRRLDEYQFTFGEGPCLDAVAQRSAVLVPDLDDVAERRWPAFRGAVLSDGIRGIFAVPILVTSECVGALDLYRERPGPLGDLVLAGAHLAAELATAPLLDLLAGSRDDEPGPAGGRADDGADDGAPEAADMDRIEVYQATGMLISALDVDADEAVLRLRAHAMASGLTASEVARAIIERRLALERDDAPGPEGPPGPRAGGSTP